MNTRIAIVGGGVAGYTAIETLRRSPIQSDIKLIWISPKPSFVYKPFLFDIYSGYRKLTDYTFPFKSYYQRFRIDFSPGKVKEFLPADTTLVLDSGQRINYEYVILASGEERVMPDILTSENSFLSNTSDELQKIADHLDAQFQLAKKQLSLLRKPFLSIVVHGNDLYSVQVLFAIYNLTDYIRKKYDLRRNEISISYVSSEKDFGGDLPIKLRDILEEYAKDHAIDVYLHTTIQKWDDGKLVLSNGTVLETKTFITNGEARLAAVYQNAGLKTDQFGGLEINNFLQLEKFYNVYAAGSLINHYDWHKKERVWHTFSNAEDQARLAALNVIAEIRGKNKLTYKPKNNVEFIPVNDQLCIGMYGDNVYFNSIMNYTRVLLAKKYFWQLTMPE
ncbi:MAG: hypothetical protein A2V81_05310 [Candidatus Abawacabacteria bacterium RBG_16_42_10]|uniref:FAD/NAD(P)-binding domain-containing protein n=1 Tax=Candidatus Abawacabacteria bacterium RBG_16_42_10 TaxID=1817814 RepID=A0A1F4XIT2_9BACT|nr:MAG: hypothetical protein A2V81_05310 [Candidatus Abawacabacteria bacterium RBG_16_42_10]